MVVAEKARPQASAVTRVQAISLSLTTFVRLPVDHVCSIDLSDSAVGQFWKTKMRWASSTMRHAFTLMAWIIVLTLISGCQHADKPIPVSSLDVYSSYGEKLRGKYLLYVEPSELSTNVKPADVNCSAHNFPLDLRAAFTGTVRKSFANLIEDLVVVESPADRRQLKSRGARGLIVVRADDISARLRVVPGAWQATIETEIEIQAGIMVDGPGGRLLGTSVSGDDQYSGALGPFCSGGEDSLTESSKGALKEVVRKLGEALVNSERVRRG